MVKLLGLLMAFAACTTIGFYKASEIKRRRILLVDFKELLIHISTEMSYFKEPLPQIFERLAGEASDNKERTILLRECLSTYSLENGCGAYIQRFIFNQRRYLHHEKVRGFSWAKRFQQAAGTFQLTEHAAGQTG